MRLVSFGLTRAAAQAGLVCTGVYYGKQQSETETLAAAEEAGSSAKGEG